MVGAVLPAAIAWVQGRPAGAADAAIAAAALLGVAGRMLIEGIRRTRDARQPS